MAKLLRDLPIGSKVKDITWKWEHRTGDNYTGSGKIKPVTWIIVAKNHTGYPDNSVTLLTHELIAQHCFDNSTDRGSNYGSNHWGNSGTTNADKGIRKFLNGSSYAGNDANSYDKTFYDAFSKEFKDAILETTVQNKDKDGNSYVTKDKVFLPSQTEYGGGSSNTYPIGADYGYFNSDSSRIAKLDGKTHHYWTRSPNSWSAYGVQHVDSEGSLDWLSAYLSLGVRPALNISSEILVSDSPDADGAYTIIYNKPPKISGQDEDLGDISDEINKPYTVFDEDSDILTVIERLNNRVIGVYNDVKSGTEFTLHISKEDIYNLPIGQKNTISIEVSDGQAKVYRVWTFTRTNTAPIIQLLTNNNLGEIIAPFETKVKITDPEGDATDLIYTVNQVVLDEDKANEYKRVPIHSETKENIALDTEITYTIPKEIWDILQLGNYELEIKAIDSQGGESKEIVKFTRTEDEINITTKPIETEIMAKQIITLPRISGNPTNLKIMACNNAFDENPTWEDITEYALNTQPYNFANTAKTATKWGIAVKFEIDGKGKEVVE